LESNSSDCVLESWAENLSRVLDCSLDSSINFVVVILIDEISYLIA
jgi:hypothetical protein